MNVWLNGELEASEPLTPGMIEEIEKVFPDLRYAGKTISIEEQNVGSFGEEMLTGVVDVLKKAGIRVEGYAVQIGDTDGRFEIAPDGTVVDLSAAQCAIMDASDRDLLIELERRGYVAMKQDACLEAAKVFLFGR